MPCMFICLEIWELSLLDAQIVKGSYFSDFFSRCLFFNFFLSEEGNDISNTVLPIKIKFNVQPSFP